MSDSEKKTRKDYIYFNNRLINTRILKLNINNFWHCTNTKNTKNIRKYFENSFS